MPEQINSWRVADRIEPVFQSDVSGDQHDCKVVCLSITLCTQDEEKTSCATHVFAMGPDNTSDGASRTTLTQRIASSHI